MLHIFAFKSDLYIFIHSVKKLIFKKGVSPISSVVSQRNSIQKMYILTFIDDYLMKFTQNTSKLCVILVLLIHKFFGSNLIPKNAFFVD